MRTVPYLHSFLFDNIISTKLKSGSNGENEKRSKLCRISEQYQRISIKDMQEALKDIFGFMFKSMLKGEMNHHLGYESNDKGKKESSNRSNGYGK